MVKLKKASEVSLLPNNILVDDTNCPIFNAEFIEAQTLADEIIVKARLAKEKDFNSSIGYTVEELNKEVHDSLSDNKIVEYLKHPSKVPLILNEKLKEEAAIFIKHIEECAKVDKINNAMQRFNILNFFEDDTCGLFFTEGIVTLNKIYKKAEILEAVIATIDLD